MSTSADQINELIGDYTDLKGYFEGVRGSIDAKIGELMAVRNNLPSALHNLIYVDQITGDDANDGSIDSPIKTLTHAVQNLTPVMGRSDIYLLRDYDLGTEIIYLMRGRIIRISNQTASTDTARAALIPRLFNEDGVDKMSGFLLSGQTQGESIELCRLNIIWPDETSGFSDSEDLNLITAFSATGGASFAVSITDSLITTGSSPVGNLIYPGGRQVDLAAVPGAYAANFAGHWVRHLAAAATQADARDIGVNCDLTSL